MSDFNKVILVGNLTRDPEARFTPTGVKIVNLRIAVTRKFKDRSGTLKEDTLFITVSVGGNQAEMCHKYLSKGRSVLVEGTLQAKVWLDKEGQKKEAIEVRAEHVQFMSGKKPENKKDVAQETEAFEPDAEICDVIIENESN